MPGEGVAVHSLHLYPIKSCRPVDVRAAHVTPTGEETVACSAICRLLELQICAPVRHPSRQHGNLPPASLRWCAGFAFDRQWVVVREADGKFITQRQVAWKLAHTVIN